MTQIRGKIRQRLLDDLLLWFMRPNSRRSRSWSEGPVRKLDGSVLTLDHFLFLPLVVESHLIFANSEPQSPLIFTNPKHQSPLIFANPKHQSKC